MTDRKSFSPPDIKLEESGEVTVAFSRFDVLDSDNDVTRSGSVPDGKTVAMSEFGHSSWDSALPIGKGVLSEMGDLGVFSGAFFLDTEQGRNGYQTVKAMGDLQEWSYGYVVLDSNDIAFEGKAAREITSLDIFEVSPVLKGAGVGTHTLAIKSDAPGTDAPLADYMSWYLGIGSALTERLRDRAEFRATEGRKLSRADLARIDDLADSWAEQHAALKALLVVPEDPEVIRKRQQAIEVALATARRLGVDVPDKE